MRCPGQGGPQAAYGVGRVLRERPRRDVPHPRERIPVPAGVTGAGCFVHGLPGRNGGTHPEQRRERVQHRLPVLGGVVGAVEQRVSVGGVAVDEPDPPAGRARADRLTEQRVHGPAERGPSVLHGDLVHMAARVEGGIELPDRPAALPGHLAGEARHTGHTLGDLFAHRTRTRVGTGHLQDRSDIGPEPGLVPLVAEEAAVDRVGARNRRGHGCTAGRGLVIVMRASLAQVGGGQSR